MVALKSNKCYGENQDSQAKGGVKIRGVSEREVKSKHGFFAAISFIGPIHYDNSR
jgi:hypothetical protein